MTTVVVVEEAEAQLSEIVAWWLVNRPAAPTLALDEFERCVKLLESSPDIGTTFHRTDVPGVCRLVMRRTKHFVYYVHDPVNAIVYIIAVWGSPKGSDPELRDPRSA
jgi:plasmid stabilization system protein ParE